MLRRGLLASSIVACAALLVAPGAASAVPPAFFGMNAVRPDAEDFRMMRDGGIETYRLGLNWRGVDRGGWGGPDRLFHTMANNGIRPFPYLLGTPRWISRDARRSVPPLGTVEQRQRWREFVREAVERYGPNGTFWWNRFLANPNASPPQPVTTWMVWNEQNAPNFWRPRAQPRRYARLLRITSRAIRSVDPNARVVIGAMYGFPVADGAMTMRRFLLALYRTGGVPQHADGVALNPYGTIAAMRRQVRQARRVMNRNGHRRAGIWIAEIGWASAGRRRHPMITTRQGQANRMRRAMRTLIRNRVRWQIRGVYPYVWRNHRDSTDRCPWCPNAGLLTVNRRPKPAWRAYHRFIAASR